MITPILAAISRQEIGLAYALAGMLMAVVFGCLGMYLVHRRRAMWHETARLALEKGQPIPPQPPEWGDRQSQSHEKGSDFRGGLVLIAIGAGLFLFLESFIGRNLGYLGAIPGFIGVALLLHGAAAALLRKKTDDQKEGGAAHS